MTWQLMWHRRIRSGIILKTTLFFGIFFKNVVKALYIVRLLGTPIYDFFIFYFLEMNDGEGEELVEKKIKV